MDEVDIAIIKELLTPHSFQWDIRRSFASLAKSVGVDEDTVRGRLRRAQDDGALRQWDLVVNPSFLGLRMAGVEVTVTGPSDRGTTLSRLKLIDGVLWINVYYGDLLAVTFLFENDQALARRLELISSIAGRILSWSEVPFPPSGIRLSETDWRLIKVLRKTPRAAYPAVAKQVGLSTRTVRRRVQRMTDARAFLLETVFDLKKLKGAVFCHVRVWPEMGSRRAELHSAIMSELKNVIWANGELPVPMYMAVCDSVGDVRDILKRVCALEGVKDSRADIPEERLTICEWFDERIEEKLTEASTRRESPEFSRPR